MPGESGYLVVEFAVGERAVAEHHGHVVGLCIRAAGEQVCDGDRLHVLRGGRPAGLQFGASPCADQRHSSCRGVRGVGEGVEHGEELIDHLPGPVLADHPVFELDRQFAAGVSTQVSGKWVVSW